MVNKKRTARGKCGLSAQCLITRIHTKCEHILHKTQRRVELHRTKRKIMQKNYNKKSENSPRHTMIKEIERRKLLMSRYRLQLIILSFTLILSFTNNFWPLDSFAGWRIKQRQVNVSIMAPVDEWKNPKYVEGRKRKGTTKLATEQYEISKLPSFYPNLGHQSELGPDLYLNLGDFTKFLFEQDGVTLRFYPSLGQSFGTHFYLNFRQSCSGLERPLSRS